jgi:hypothetical protein
MMEQVASQITSVIGATDKEVGYNGLSGYNSRDLSRSYIASSRCYSKVILHTGKSL